jgi:hypothetical protein
MRGQMLVLTALFVCSLPLVTTRIYASDEVQYFSYLRSLWFDHDVSFENEYQHFYDSGVTQFAGFHETFLERTTDTGRRETFSTIGSALLWSPFYAVADLIVHLRRAAGDPVAADGYSPPYIAAVSYGSAVYGWLSLMLSLLIVRHVLGPGGRAKANAGEANAAGAASDAGGSVGAGASAVGRADAGADAGRGRRGVGDGADAGADADAEDADAIGLIGLVSALAIWFGTPLFFYMYIAPPMSHGCSAFAVAAFILTWLRIRRDWSAGGLIALGALAALMAMVREQDIFIAIAPAADWAIDLWLARRRPDGARDREDAGARAGDEMRRPRPTPTLAQLVMRGVLGAVAFGIAYLPQVAAYWVINGYLGPSKLVARKLTWTSPHALGVLASTEHGLLFWTPLVLLSIAGLVWLAVRPGPANSRWVGSLSAVSPRADVRRSDSRVEGAASDRRRVAICLLLMAISQVYIAGCVESWTVAGAFGQRRFVGLASLFVVGLAALLALARAAWALPEPTSTSATASSSETRSTPRRGPQIVCAIAIGLGVWWNLGLMAQFGAGLMDRQRLELGRNTYQTFVTIPLRLPELAYRYLFARRSFYQPATPQAAPPRSGGQPVDPGRVR